MVLKTLPREFLCLNSRALVHFLRTYTCMLLTMDPLSLSQRDIALYAYVQLSMLDKQESFELRLVRPSRGWKTCRRIFSIYYRLTRHRLLNDTSDNRQSCRLGMKRAWQISRGRRHLTERVVLSLIPFVFEKEYSQVVGLVLCLVCGSLRVPERRGNRSVRSI